MNKINLLDCTLRDGGYINNWAFGLETIKNILTKLVTSGVEYIECGYLSEKKGGNPESTQYKDFDAIRKVVPDCNEKQRFAVMIDFGQMEMGNVPPAENDSPIIRVCFHKKDKDSALDFCKGLMEKGYNVFVQPTLRDTIQVLTEAQPLVAEDAEMAVLVQQTIQKMQQLNEQQFKGLELEWHRPEDDIGK